MWDWLREWWDRFFRSEPTQPREILTGTQAEILKLQEEGFLPSGIEPGEVITPSTPIGVRIKWEVETEQGESKVISTTVNVSAGYTLSDVYDYVRNQILDGAIERWNLRHSDKIRSAKDIETTIYEHPFDDPTISIPG